ncbi:MAG TPA: zinc-dependent alcohol dehydrogenase [Chloroflexia bacterium]|nr:zinc-dependent alcohol dehydrogenase [Chloroflexia bacterium]
MNALVAHDFDEPLSLQQVPVPRPGPGQVLVKVKACGICHMDLHALDGDWKVKPALPFIPGHEISGIVTGLGAGVEKVKTGDRVGVSWLNSACGSCEYCQSGRESLCPARHNTGYTVNGGFAEYVVVNADYLVPIPEQLTFEEAAPFMCAGLSSYKAVKSAGLQPGQWVAIYGVGGVGNLAVQYALAMGLKVVAIDRDEAKLKLARQLGAQETVNCHLEDPVTAVQAGLGGAHAVIVTAPEAQAVENSLSLLRPGATCILLGHASEKGALDIFNLVEKGLTVRGLVGGSPAELREALQFAAEGKVKPVYRLARLAEINHLLGQLQLGRIEGSIVLQL